MIQQLFTLADARKHRDWRCTGCGHVAFAVNKPRRCIAFDDCSGKMEILK